MIQKTLREQLGPDVTVITVAHRLQTIMDADKIVRPNATLLIIVHDHWLVWRVDGSWWWQDSKWFWCVFLPHSTHAIATSLGWIWHTQGSPPTGIRYVQGAGGWKWRWSHTLCIGRRKTVQFFSPPGLTAEWGVTLCQVPPLVDDWWIGMGKRHLDRITKIMRYIHTVKRSSDWCASC